MDTEKNIQETNDEKAYALYDQIVNDKKDQDISRETKDISFNYLDAKKELKELKNEREKLVSELKEAIGIAEKSGMTAERSERIQTLTKDIAERSEKEQGIVEKMDSFERETMDKLTHGVSQKAEQVKEATKTIKEAAMDKIRAGVTTLKAMSERVKDANRAVIAKVETAKDSYGTRLSEDIERYNRNFMSYCYNKDARTLQKLEKKLEKIEEKAQHKADVKQAFKNLGRALTGKEIDREKAVASPDLRRGVELLKEQINELKKDMKELERQYNFSKQMSLQNLRSSKELREANNMKESKDIERRIEAATKESIREQSRNKENKTADLSKERETVRERTR